jgi:hypothetical protein
VGGILVVYAARTYPLRATIADHLYAFRRHSGRPCYYLNLLDRRPARHLSRLRLDAVVLHTTLLSERWSLPTFWGVVERARRLRDVAAVKIALPQDEFFQTGALEECFRALGVTHVFSVMPESEWPAVYPETDRARVRFSRVLTGYLEQETLARIDRLAARVPARDIDIGYRAWHAAPWLGRHGRLKVEVAEVFQRRAAATGIRTDISTRNDAVLLGDAWYEFLLRCRYTLGVEGGASILDRDGAIRRRTDDFVGRHPEATFEEIERACFAGADGAVRLVALSPRHLEACVTRTCQILVEGEYNGILRPGEHYFPLRPDLRNVDEALALVRDETRRGAMTERAYRDVVASGAYTYREFVARVLAEACGGADAPAPACRPGGPRSLYAWGAVADRASWVRVRFWVWCFRCVERLPLPVRRIARQVRRRVQKLVLGI